MSNEKTEDLEYTPPPTLGNSLMIPSIIEKLPPLLKALTGRRLMWLTLGGLVALFLALTWDQRTKVMDSVALAIRSNALKLKVVSEQSKVQMAQLVYNSDLVVGIQVVSIGLPETNVRRNIHIITDNNKLQQAFLNYFKNEVYPRPLLLSGLDEFTIHNNNRLADVMSGKFLCYPTPETLIARDVPMLVEFSPLLCSISIPPYEGSFSGYLNLFLSRSPSPDELEQLRGAARIIAMDIFDRDIR